MDAQHIDLGSFELPEDEPVLPAIRPKDTLAPATAHNGYLQAVLTEDQLEVLEKSELAELMLAQQEYLSRQAIKAEGNLYLLTNIEFAQVTGETFALRDAIEHKEHRSLVTAMLKIMNNELPAALIQNYRTTTSAINRTAASDLTPSPKVQQELERRRPTFLEWLFAEEVAVDAE